MYVIFHLWCEVSLQTVLDFETLGLWDFWIRNAQDMSKALCSWSSCYAVLILIEELMGGRGTHRC